MPLFGNWPPQIPQTCWATIAAGGALLSVRGLPLVVGAARQATGNYLVTLSAVAQGLLGANVLGISVAAFDIIDPNMQVFGSYVVQAPGPNLRVRTWDASGSAMARDCQFSLVLNG